MEITSYYKGLNSTDHNDVKYNMFLLGSNRNYNGGYINNTTDSYNIATYFTPANTGSRQPNLVAKETPYASGITQNSPDSYSVNYWWLRSGSPYYNYDYFAIYVGSSGIVIHNQVTGSVVSLRPAFVLNLA